MPPTIRMVAAQALLYELKARGIWIWHAALFALVATLESAAQQDNLVPNPGFEEIHFSHCGDFGTVEQFETTIVKWLLPTQARPRIVDMDVAPHCWNYASGNDSSLPHSGRRMILLSLLSTSEYRSYLEARLESPLVKGRRYYTEIWIRGIAESACNNLGLLFSDTLIKTHVDKQLNVGGNTHIMGILKYKPQVNHQETILATSNWVCLRASFVAGSCHKYLLIGNFLSNDETNTTNFPDTFTSSSASGIFYAIDDIYVGERPRTAKEIER